MMRLLLTLALTSVVLNSYAHERNPKHAWFDEARFGMFVHFGVFSTLCDGEWSMYNQKIKVADYHKLQHIFTPQFFDPAEWVAVAKSAGMKYIIFTSRHHDGFSNWDTTQSEWNIMNTPYGKDIVRQLTDECHRQGMKIGLYYSLIDWFHEDYAHSTARSYTLRKDSARCNWNNYIAFMKAQLTELLTNYGEISIVWFDGEWDQLPFNATSHDQSKVDWHFDEIYGLIHKLQPHCMIANNHHLEAQLGEDYQIFEKDLPGQNESGLSGNQQVSAGIPLETCESINGSWGYDFQDDHFKTTTELIHLLVRSAGYGANLLLNVGPQPTGKIEETCLERLAEVGEWMKEWGHTLYGTQAGPVKPQEWGAVTRKGNVLYIHVLKARTNTLTIPVPGKIASAKWLNVPFDAVWKRNRKTGKVTFDLDVPLHPVDAILEITIKQNNL